MARLFQSSLIWAAVYVGLLAGIAVGMFSLRDKLVDQNRQERASWEAFREDTAAQRRAKTGPVEHTVPPSEEPPMLVLMRDHFPTMFVAALVLPAIILGFLMLVTRGVIRQSAERKAARPAKTADPVPPTSDSAS